MKEQAEPTSPLTTVQKLSGSMQNRPVVSQSDKNGNRRQSDMKILPKATIAPREDGRPEQQEDV
jgi:hypothetical protein